jgi:ACS family tartrate transporter-like MFS transporter
MNEDRVCAKCGWRLIPFMVLLYVVFFLDRVNVGFAALTMNADLNFSPSVYGLGAGLLFAGFCFFSVPSSVILERVGARRWLFVTLAVWGALSAGTAFVKTPAEFYAVRFLLGVAEAGFVPGIVFYLTLWFPRHYRGQFTAGFLIAQPVAFMIGSPLSGFMLGMDAVAGLRGWQWLFLIEGLPSCVLAFVALYRLPDRPGAAAWLTEAEKHLIVARLAADAPVEHSTLLSALCDLRVVLRVVAIGFVNLGVFFGLSGITLWFPLIVQGMGFSTFTTSIIVALPFAAAIGAKMAWGRSSDRKGELFWHVALPLLVAGAGFATASLAPSDVLVLLALSVAVIGIYPSLSPLISLPVSFLGGAAGAGATALIYAIGGIGAFAGPAIIGRLKEDTGNYASGMGALAVALVLAALLILGTGRVLAPRSLAARPEPGGR